MPATSNLLIIEDNPADAYLVREELQSTAESAVQIDVCGTLAEGLNYMDQHKVDGLLLDLSLPDSFGVETVSRVRQHSPQLPLVVLTGNQQNDLALQAIRAGAQDYVIKGQCDGKTLLRSLLYALERSSSHDRTHKEGRLDSIRHIVCGNARVFEPIMKQLLVNLDTLEARLTSDRAAMTDVREARRIAMRGARIAAQMLTFGKRHDDDAEAVNLSDIVSSALPDLDASTRRSGVYVKTNLQDSVWTTRLDTNDLQLALLHLVANAVNSMTAFGGYVTINTRNLRLSANEFAEGPIADGEYVLVAVEDIGLGIPPNVISYVTEPFFTTHESDVHSGLGLSIVESFVARSGGFMRIFSHEDCGTTVQMFFPRHRPPASASARAVKPSSPCAPADAIFVGLPKSHQEKVTALLSRLGHSPQYVDEASAAVELVRTNPEIDTILVCNYDPHEVSDREFIEDVYRIRADIEIIFADEDEYVESEMKLMEIFSEGEFEDLALTAHQRKHLH